MRFDLHIHTNMSDGQFTPSQVAALAEGNADVIAITDHDCVGGASIARETANIRVISGVELSASGGREIHILGYHINESAGELYDTLNKLARFRVERAKRMIEKLNARGIDLTLDEIEFNRKTGTVGRLHIARALLKRGIVANTDEAFDRFLGRYSCAYESRMTLKASECIRLIQSAGGVASLAHPVTCGSGLKDLLKELKGFGLAAVEAYYPVHTNAQVEYYEKLAIENGLLVTCGSDFHDFTRGNTKIGCERRSSAYLEESLKVLFP